MVCNYRKATTDSSEGPRKPCTQLLNLNSRLRDETLIEDLAQSVQNREAVKEP